MSRPMRMFQSELLLPEPQPAATGGRALERDLGRDYRTPLGNAAAARRLFGGGLRQAQGGSARAYCGTAAGNAAPAPGWC